MIRTLSRRSLLATLALSSGAFPAVAWSQSAGSFDHRHAAWDQLLRRHVVVAADGDIVDAALPGADGRTASAGGLSRQSHGSSGVDMRAGRVRSSSPF